MRLNRLIQLFVCVASASFGNSLMAPLFRVTGMSGQLPDLCVVDYKKDKVDINVEVMMTGCGRETLDGTITSTEWKFYKLNGDNKYTVDTVNPHKNVIEESSSILWDGFSRDDMHIFAVEASVTLKGFQDSFRIMGFIVVGCKELSENEKDICRNVKQSVNSLAGNMRQIWHLGRCNNTVSTYKATSTVEFTVSTKGGNPDYSLADLYAAGLYLGNKNTIVFQVKCKSSAFILLEEDKADGNKNDVEIEIGGKSNKKSLLKEKENGRTVAEFDEKGILSKEEFRFFWISFAGEEVRVGKGEIPYADEILRWDGLQHDINYIAIGNKKYESVWKFNIDLCMQPPRSESCKETKWKYSRDLSTCERSCEGSNNCFQTENMCEDACEALSTIPYGDACTDANKCITKGAVCIGSPSTCTCDSMSNYIEESDSCQSAIPYGDACTDANKCITKGAVCIGSPSTCTCDSMSNYIEESDSCQLAIPYGDACTYANKCITKGAVCIGSPSTCTCDSMSNYIEESDSCQLAIPYGDACTDANKCITKGAVCIGSPSTCTCDSMSNYIEESDSCQSAIPYGDACTDANKCITKGAVCIGSPSTCTCDSMSNYIEESDSCQSAIPYGDACTDANKCITKGAVCIGSPSTCTCDSMSNYIEESDSCQSAIPYGDACTYANKCITKGAVCIGSPSTCTCDSMSNYIEESDSCQSAIPYGDACTDANKCITKGAVCIGSPSTCTCDSMSNYIEESDSCQSAIPYGDACTDANKCITKGAVCIGSPSTCTCDSMSNYIEESDSCQSAAMPYKGACTDASQCSTKAAVCSGISSTCTCDSQSNYDEASDSCQSGRNFYQNHKLSGWFTCLLNCKRERNPGKRLKLVVDSGDSTSEDVSSYMWTVKECGSMHVETCKDGATVERNHKSLLRFLKPKDSKIDVFEIFVEVLLTDKRKASASLVIKFSPVPKAGECTVSPLTGYILLTDFNVTCGNFTVKGRYNMTYTMRSNTINKWKKGRQFYHGPQSTLTNLKLPEGDAKNHHRLFIVVRAYIDSGAMASYTTMIQVLPSHMAPAGRSVMETAKSMTEGTNAIDAMIEAGNQDEAVHYLNIISSFLNSGNTTDDNDTVSRDKTQVRTAVVANLEKVNVSSPDQLFTVVQTLNEVTKTKTELSESTQDRAADLFDKLADSLDSYSDGSLNISDIVESAGEIFAGVTQLLDIKVDEGSKQFSKNKTDSKEDEQIDVKMDKMKKSSGKLLKTVNKIGSTLLSNQIVGDPAIVMKTETMHIHVEKIQKETLVEHTLSDDDNGNNTTTSLRFPSVISALDEELSDLGVQMLHMKKNPYVWDKTASEVNMDVMSVDLRSENNSEVSLTNLSQPVKIMLTTPGAGNQSNSTLLLYISKNATNIMYNHSRSNMLTSYFTTKKDKTTVLSMNSDSQIRKFKIFVSENGMPTFDQVMDFGVTYPDQVSSLTQNFSRFYLSNDTAESSRFIYFTFNNSMNMNYTGRYFVGVTLDLERNSTLEDLQLLDSGCLGNETAADCESMIEVALQVETRTLACTYWDEPSQTWSSQGCEVTPFSTDEKLECLCTHLTAFSGGVFVLPNFVDPIADVALFLTFFDNPVVVTAVIVVWLLYFFLIHWARQTDRKDQEQVGVVAVGDVETNSKYLYLVCIVTGWWKEAGTTANVFFYMTGSNGSSKRIKLTTPTRLCFQTGNEDWFLVSTEESLGELQDISLWHDNSGTSSHWYLSQVFVKDLQEKKSWTFIYNDWLAVDRGSLLLTTAYVSAVTKEQLRLKQKHNFIVKTTQDLRDSHLWVSIFSKPARSTFTRVQRVTCALSLLLTTMLTNIMFYGIPTDDPDDQVGGSRGIVISLSSIVIGIQSSLLMFPVNVIIMQMFLKLKQRPFKEEVIKKQQSYVQSLYDRVSKITTDVLKELTVEDKSFRDMGTKDESSSPSSFVMASEDIEPSPYDEPGHSIQVTYSGSVTSDSYVRCSEGHVANRIAMSKTRSPRIVVLSESKQTGKILPWWFIYIAWILVLGVSIVCSYFVMLYGLKYGYQRSVEWLVSFLTGFSQSALITQPLKVLAVAIVITLIFKKTVEFEDYGPEVKLDEDALYVNSVNKNEETHIPHSQPLSSNLLKEIRQRIQLEWLMDMTLIDICLYIMYIVVVCIVVYGHRDVKEAYYNSVAIEDVLVNPGCINLNLCFFLAKVDNVKTFYQYIYEVAIPNLADMSKADHEYATPCSSHFLIGPWRLRQLRVDRGTCGEGADKLFNTFNMHLPECTGPYWLGDEENRDFNSSWGEPISGASDPPTKWSYWSAWKLKTVPIKGILGTYSGGGYIITMPSDHTLHEGIIQEMWNTDWIDERTRAIFLEFTVYNPNADLFSVVIILFEYSNNGAVFPYHQIFSTRLYHYSTDFAIFVAVCECLFLLFNISFAYNEWKKCSVLGKQKYFEDYWSYVEIIQIVLSFTVVGLFFHRLVVVNGVMKDFRESDGSSFISFYTAITWDFILGYLMGFLVALVTLKAIKLLKFNKRTYMVADTISHSKSSIFSFLALAVIVTIAFGHFTTIAFGRIMEDYRDMFKSLMTLFNFAMGVSDLPGLQETNRILGPVYYVIFVFVITFVFLNIFAAILNFGISDSKTMFEKRQNKFELLEYVLKKMKTALNVEQ